MQYRDLEPMAIWVPSVRPERAGSHWIAGFSLIQVRSKEEAIEWASRAPLPEGTQLEIRQVFEDDDFAPSDPTGELRASDAKRRQPYAREA